MPTPDIETLTQRISQPRAPASRIRQRPKKKRPPKALQCPNPDCQSDKIEESEGASVCTECGTSFNESNIVSEVQFGETAAGAAVVQGSFVGEGRGHAAGDGSRFANQKESREVSEANGREELRKQTNWHRLPDHIFDRAFQIYKVALGVNFIQGRTTASVAAVCLYAACRSQENVDLQLLLIDFAEGIAVNVFKLGQTWTTLKEKVQLHELKPVVDVEEMVNRFVKRLEFGRDWQNVASDTLLLLRRMKRDWMVTGRRPNGLIGACIILAARMNNYRRSVREVVYVTRVADVTIATRLAEFRRTAASTMTVEDFRDRGLRLRQGEPPSLYKRREREMRQRLLEEALDDNDESARPILNLHEVEPLHRSPSATPRSTATQSPPRTPQPHRRDADGFAIPDLPIDPNLLNGGHASPSTVQSAPKAVARQKRGATSIPPDDDNESVTSETRSRVGWKKGRKRIVAAIPWTEADLISEQELAREMEIILEDPKSVGLPKEQLPAATDADVERSLELAARLRRAVSMEPNAEVSNDPEINAAEFEDDPEVTNCLLTPEEQRIKEKIWVTHNEDWLRSQQAKQLKRTLDEAAGVKPKETDPNKKKRKRPPASRMADGSLLRGKSVSTAAEAAQIMINKHSKNPSKHIDYAALQAVFTPEPRSSSEDPGSRASSRAPSVMSRAPSMARTSQARSVRGASRDAPIEIGDDDEPIVRKRGKIINLVDDDDDDTPAVRSNAATPTRTTPSRPTLTTAGLTTPDQTQRVSQAAGRLVTDAIPRGSARSNSAESLRPLTPLSSRKRAAGEPHERRPSAEAEAEDEDAEAGQDDGTWNEEADDEDEDADDDDDEVNAALDGDIFDDDGNVSVGYATDEE